MLCDVGLGIIKVIHEFDLNKTSAMLTSCAFFLMRVSDFILVFVQCKHFRPRSEVQK